MTDTVKAEELLGFKDKSVHVVGIAGTEGAGMLRLLHGLGFTNLTAHDFHTQRDFRTAFMNAHAGLDRASRKRLLGEVQEIDVECHQGNRYLEGIDSACIVAVPQSWHLYPQNNPLERLHKKGIPFFTLTQAFSWLFQGRLVGITGTKGKSTTANMIDTILSRSRVRHVYAGNDRRSEQAIEVLLDPSLADVLLLEVSNRQLADARIRPHIGVLTNVLEDHIEEHGGFDRYADVKASLFRFQAPHDVAIINHDDEQGRRIARRVVSRLRVFSTTEKLAEGAFLDGDTLVIRDASGAQVVGHLDNLTVDGMHNVANALAAALACDSLGLDADVISEGLHRFGGLPGRMELIGEYEGVRFYSDVNSTIPASTVAGLTSLDGRVVLIAGGQSKGLDYASLAHHLRSTAEAVVLLPGSGADLLEGLLDNDCAVEVIRCDTLPKAVAEASRRAVPGSAILLSPASASFYGSFIRPLNKTLRMVVDEVLGDHSWKER